MGSRSSFVTKTAVLQNRRLDLVTMPTLRTTCQGGQLDALPIREEHLPLKAEQTLIGVVEILIG